jgi:dipeptidyl aminopeptidase/acylaminoacyl peptidase
MRLFIAMAVLASFLAPRQDRFVEESVTVGAGEWSLPGTLTMPVGRGPFPGLVLVHGSGPHDRDESIGPNKPFRDLAWGLANAGIAVLRYEKRTSEYKEKFATLRSFTVREETIDDAVLAVASLRNNPRINAQKIFVLGHSLGGMLAPRIAEADPRIAGLVLLAGASRHLSEIVVDQMEYLGMTDASLIDPKLAMASLRHEATRVMNPDLPLDIPASELLLELPASYWRDLTAYHPADAAAGLRIPMLILQGGRDYQVTLTDLRGWHDALEGRMDVVEKVYPDLNHLFMTGNGKSTPAEYEIPGQVAEQVISDIGSWIKAR